MATYGEGRRQPTLSVEEFAKLPEEDGYRIELVRGMMVREPQPGGRHGRLVTRILRSLDAHTRQTGAGEVLTHMGFRLPTTPPSVRGPDVAFLRAERVPDEMPVGFWEGAPDLAVEVLSPSNRWSQIEEKVADYLDSGAAAVWVVDGAKQRVHAYHSADSALVLSGDDVLEDTELLPGFRLAMGELFA